MIQSAPNTRTQRSNGIEALRKQSCLSKTAQFDTLWHRKSIHLNRTGESTIAIYTRHRTNEVDDRGYFVLTKHVLVTFVLIGIQTVQLDDFKHQNVISGLGLEETPAGYRLTLHLCFGARGMLEAKHIRIIVQPGNAP